MPENVRQIIKASDNVFSCYLFIYLLWKKPDKYLLDSDLRWCFATFNKIEDIKWYQYISISVQNLNQINCFHRIIVLKTIKQKRSAIPGIYCIVTISQKYPIAQP